MTNEPIRRRASENGVKLWELAQKMGIADTTFSKRMRRQFTEEETARALRYIDEIAEEKQRELDANEASL